MTIGVVRMCTGKSEPFPSPYCPSFQTEYRAWYDTTKPNLYTQYQFRACGKFYFYYKSKGVMISEKPISQP
jgi:hypothetical protein